MMLMAKLEDIKYDLSKEDINAEFYFKNSNPKKIYSIVPVSSKTGEGIADLLSLLVYTAQNWMLKKIIYQVLQSRLVHRARLPGPTPGSRSDVDWH
jgi:translation initiation factor IF-2